VRAVVHDPARLAVVHALGPLGGATPLDRITRLAARLLQAPSAFIAVVDEARDQYLSAAGTPPAAASPAGAPASTFCHYAIANAPIGAPLVVPDAGADRAYRDVPVVRDARVAAYLGVPLVVRGQAVGTLCVVDAMPRAWSTDDVEVLGELAASVRRELELRLAAADAERREVALEARTEDAERARHRAEAILGSISDAFFALDREWRFTYLNDRAEQLLRPRGELLGRAVWDAFPLAVGTAFEHEYRRAMTSGEPVAFEAHYPPPLDSWFEVRAYPGRDGLAVYFQDVNARHRAAQALAESEARFRIVQEASPNGFLTLRPEREGGRVVDFTYTYVNTAGARILAGRRPEDLVGRRLLSVFPGVVTEGLLDAYARVADTGESYSREFLYRRDELDVGFRVTAVRAGGDVAITYSDESPRLRAEAERDALLAAERAARADAEAARAALDVANAALRASEARLRDVFEQAPVAVAVLEGPDHVYTVVSPPYARSAGQGRPLLGRTFREAFPEVAGTGYYEVMDRVYATGEPFFAAERRVLLRDADGAAREHFFNVGYQPLRDAHGEVYAVASVAYDVTDQVRARREVEAAWQAAESARREAEHANRARADFLAVMSHELRTPLNAIGGYAELLEMGVRGPITAAQRDDLLRIQRSQRHLLGLVNEVLNYAKLEAGSVRYDLVDVPVRAAVTEAEGLVMPQARAKGLTLDIGDCPPGLAARADREKLRQVLVNLLSNAVKFTERGGATIDVDCDEAAGTVAIRVRDTGIGIPADKYAAIFEPFVQVRADLARTAEGTGLGLAISRDLARGMGGDLTVESRLGGGSTFTLTLPQPAPAGG
jgi:PAS domain S-box-containing protein